MWKEEAADVFKKIIIIVSLKKDRLFIIASIKNVVDMTFS